MPAFSQKSINRLETCDQKLQVLFLEVVKHYDCAILEGYRNKEDQNEHFDAGRSELKHPQSKHNQVPSLGIDVAPYPIKWQDVEGWYHFAGFVKGVASQMGIAVRWGGDWDSDYDLHDQLFNDFPHWELVDG